MSGISDPFLETFQGIVYNTEKCIGQNIQFQMQNGFKY